MKKENACVREITFFSKKCDCTISVLGKEARALAEKLENDSRILRYKSKIPFTVNPSIVSVHGLRPAYLAEKWVSDFYVETVDGEFAIIEAVSSENLLRKSEMEKLEISRRHWRANGKKWFIHIVNSKKAGD